MAFDIQTIWNNSHYELMGYEELANSLKESVKKYKELVVTEDAITSAKIDRATLNNKRKKIDKFRKQVVEEATSLFETQCKSLNSIIDEAIKNIDSQIKDFEENKKKEKEEEIKKIWESKDSVYFPLEKIWNNKWLNATYSLSSIEKEIDLALENYVLNMETLKSMCITSIEWNLGLDILSKTLDLNKALAEIKRVRTATSDTIEGQTTKEVKTDDKIYELGFIINATIDQVEALNEFLGKNKINFVQLSKEEIRNLKGE